MHHKFKDSLHWGKLGETLVRAILHAKENPKQIDDFDALLDTGCPIEIKTDFTLRPSNFYFECYANLNKRSSGEFDGGCFKARGAARFYVYYFASRDELFIFHTEELARRLEAKADCLQTREANNGSYRTLGFVVSITAAKYLAIRIPVEPCSDSQMECLRQRLKNRCLELNEIKSAAKRSKN